MLIHLIHYNKRLVVKIIPISISSKNLLRRSWWFGWFKRFNTRRPVKVNSLKLAVHAGVSACKICSEEMSWITTMRMSSAQTFKVCEIRIFQKWQLCKPCQHSHLFMSTLAVSALWDDFWRQSMWSRQIFLAAVLDHYMMVIKASFFGFPNSQEVC